MVDLKQKIDVILNEEKRAYQLRGRRGGWLGTFNIGVQGSGSSWTDGIVPSVLKFHSDPNFIKSTNADVLLRLYAALNSKDKDEAKVYLFNQLSRDSTYFDVAYLVFFVLCKIGGTVEAVKNSRIKLKGDLDHGFSNMLAMLSQIISHDYASFDTETYLQIEAAMEGEAEYNFKLFEKINAAKLEILKSELRDINPEINYDRQKVINLWSQFFDSPEVPAVIEEIEQYFVEGEFTESKFATCIGRVRVLLGDVTRKIAISMKEDTKITERSKEHQVFDYLRSAKFISDDIWSLTRTLHSMTSDEGAHASIAPREYARLTKNMAYELILMLLIRYNDMNN